MIVQAVVPAEFFGRTSGLYIRVEFHMVFALQLAQPLLMIY